MTSLSVDDHDEALRFYPDVLGFELRADDPIGNGIRWLAVGSPGQNMELLLEPSSHRAIPPSAHIATPSQPTGLRRHHSPSHGPQDQVKVADFRLLGQRFVCIDSPVPHDWDMISEIALFIESDDDTELERLLNALGDDGTVHMPLDAYGFGRRFGWVEDRFGVSWLLNID